MLPWFEALLASLLAMIVEAVEIRIGAEQVDDNILIPLVAAIVIMVIRTI